MDPRGSRSGAVFGLRARLMDTGPLVALAVGCAAFLAAALPVPDLQAAEARAQAAADGVGQLYWLSWFGGSTPAQYSILSPMLSSAVGARGALLLATAAIGILVRLILAGRPQARSASYIAVACALLNLWSGRVAFAVGCAIALGSLLAWQRRRMAVSAGLNALAGLASPLASAFLLLGLSGTILARGSDRRRDGILLFAATGAGLALQAALFGMPGPMPFSVLTFLASIGVVASAFLVPTPRPIRVSLVVAGAAMIVLFLVPNGIGANIERFAVLVVPVVVWATSRADRRLVVLGLIPALAYAGYGMVSDLGAAMAPSARPSYYAAVRAELLARPESQDYRVEAIDTTTHGAANALVPGMYLARGWEDHDDSALNGLFYTAGALSAVSYRQWLDDNAVGLVAVPSSPLDAYAPEAELVTSGLDYLTLVWADANWRVYTVANPAPIVAAPAQLISADQSELVIKAPTAMTATLRIRPSPYLRLYPTEGGPPVCPIAAGDSAVQAQLPSAGDYAVRASFSLRSVASRVPLLGGAGSC